MASFKNHFSLLQTISIIYFLFTLTWGGSSLSHNEECSALYQFKKNIIHQDDEFCIDSWFQTFHSWKPKSNASNTYLDCCSWYGVECSNDQEYDQVIGLDLSESSICGHINSTNTLFSLVHLQSLNLAMNYLDESEIPSEIARLKQLRSLNLSTSGFSGQVPNEISQLTHLTSLDLSWNPLKLHNPSLKNLVQNLTVLEELVLSKVDISSSVPHFLANLSSLRLVKLNNCSLHNELPADILQLPKLKFLNMNSNINLTGSFPRFYNKSLLEHVDLSLTALFGIVPESIGNLNHLTYLRLSDCSFSGYIPRSLSNLTQLTALGLGRNHFTGFVPSLASLSKLNILELTGNKFENGRVPNWLGKLTELTNLYAYDMNINSEIPPFISNLTRLSGVGMGRNSLIGQIPSSFFNLTQLVNIDLQENELQGPISSSFSNFKNLQILGLHINNFSGNVDVGMFLGFKKLEVLMIGYNKVSLVTTNNHTNSSLPQLEHLDLTSCNLKEFPPFLRFENKMIELLLGNNNIDGLVPMWIWNNSQETLQLIDLSNNFITGFHQYPYIFPWRRLQGFFMRNNQVGGQLPVPPHTTVSYDISNNNLTGEIPPVICEVKSLRLLDLSSNYMSGTLPPCMGSLSNSLVVLNLRRNYFHGKMMNAFMNGSLLESIDLSENIFNGQLPRSLTNCSNLEVLCLGDNSFDDSFPFWLGTLANLQVLILRSNKFHGSIQGSITICSQFPKLRIIDLSNNGFSGQLHENYFQTCHAMKSVFVGISSIIASQMSFELLRTNWTYSMTIVHKGVKTDFIKVLTIFMAIDLSCNHFEGQIPLSLQDLRGLESLNLSNNHFVGRVFPSLGYLKNLESLDLSQNDLSGEIPLELVQLNFLSIFNVSFNQLEGRIPQGGQFNTFENNSFEGNPGLCGKPLANDCEVSKPSRLPTTSNTFSESLLPSEIIDWIIISCGVGSGLVVGVVIGNFLYARYGDRFLKRKDKWVRPLRNMRRN